MKKEYNKATISDMPLDTVDSSLDLPSGPRSSAKQIKKPKINVIQNAKTAKKIANSAATKTNGNNLKQKLAKNQSKFGKVAGKMKFA